MPKGIAKVGTNKGWFKKEHKTNVGKEHPLGTKNRISKSLLREKHFNWKGGKILDEHGYIFIKNRSHPMCNSQGYIREHRLVMEKHIGRLLLRKEIVHHINGNTSDNRIENLKLFKNHGYHLNFHKKLNKATRAKFP